MACWACSLVQPRTTCLPRVDPPTVIWTHPYQQFINKIPWRHVYRPICWRHFHNWDSLFPGDSSSSQGHEAKGAHLHFFAKDLCKYDKVRTSRFGACSISYPFFFFNISNRQPKFITTILTAGHTTELGNPSQNSQRYDDQLLSGKSGHSNMVWSLLNGKQES